MNAHVTWLKDWSSTRAQIPDLADDTPEEVKAYEQIEALSILLATKQAASLDDLLAQVYWLKTEMSSQLQSVASPAHDQVFDNILKTVETLRDQSTGDFT